MSEPLEQRRQWGRRRTESAAASWFRGWRSWLAFRICMERCMGHTEARGARPWAGTYSYQAQKAIETHRPLTPVIADTKAPERCLLKDSNCPCQGH